MITTLTVLLILTVSAAAFLLAPRLIERRLVFESGQDQPKPFGEDMAWIAIASTDTNAVAQHLGLEGLKPANWNAGVGAIYDSSLADQYVFLTPPVGGWTLLASAALPLPLGANFADKVTPLLEHLSSKFGDCRYFAAFPGIDVFAWFKFASGRLVRAYAVSEAGVLVNREKPTREEKALGIKLYEVRGIRGRKGDAGGTIVLHPTSDQVFSLAARWAINPMRMDQTEAGTGFVALVPPHWRPERLRKAA